MKELLIIAVTTFSAILMAAEREKSVKECAAQVRRESPLQANEKQSLEICKKYSQKIVDCALVLKREKSMTMTLQDALEDCARPRD